MLAGAITTPIVFVRRLSTSTAELGHVVEVRARDDNELYRRIAKVLNIRSTKLLVAEVKHHGDTRKCTCRLQIDKCQLSNTAEYPYEPDLVTLLSKAESLFIKPDTAAVSVKNCDGHMLIVR